ncbi:hypothetical protein CUMW_137350 [Citrus unshiu]|uniref:Uncharacterized protein n=1 Tax=Citrus unshiu TaxID=55188 RepID=A0A2H5PHJ7_CITUN|nr:hypothetical protein CUMW_137350 [Citrus unshiu]
MLLEVLNTYMVYHMRVLFIEILNHPIFFSEMTYGLKLRFATHSDPENIIYLVKWFRTMLIKQEKLQMAVDETIEFNEETLATCCASRLCQRPDMGKVVNVLSSLAELRKPQQHT